MVREIGIISVIVVRILPFSIDFVIIKSNLVQKLKWEW